MKPIPKTSRPLLDMVSDLHAVEAEIQEWFDTHVAQRLSACTSLKQVLSLKQSVIEDAGLDINRDLPGVLAIKFILKGSEFYAEKQT